MGPGDSVKVTYLRTGVYSTPLQSIFAIQLFQSVGNVDDHAYRPSAIPPLGC